MKKFSLKKTLLRTIKGILPVCFLLLSVNMYADEFAGQTTAGTYEVSSLATLQLVQVYVNGTGATAPYTTAHTCASYIFNQTADLDLVSIANFTPIGTSAVKFTGTYDGQNHSITNFSFTYSGTDTNYSTGLFGYTDSNSKLQNINVVNATVVGYVKNNGILVGYSKGTITNCSTSGTLTGTYTSGDTNCYNGGIVGYADGSTISDSHTSATVTGYKWCGGFVSYTNGTTKITNCYATGSLVISQNNAYAQGGFIGYVNNTQPITNCYSSVSINLNGKTNCTNFGGFFGYVNSASALTIENCYATGNVNGASDLGGFAGFVNNSPTIRNCYATGAVTGTAANNGGFAGEIAGSSPLVYNCYAKGDVTGTTNVGGFAGHLSKSLKNCYATGAVSGTGSVGGIVGYVETTTSIITGCVALNPSLTRTSGTDANFGAVIGKNTASNTSTPNYSFASMTLPTGTLTGSAGTTLTKTQIRTATNWWDGSLATPAGYFSSITVTTPAAATFVPTDVWTFANDQLPVLKNAFFVNQSATLPSHLDGTTQALQSLEINNKLFNVANNKLNILEDGVSSIQIYNLSGRLVLDKAIKSKSVDVSTLSAGIYIIKANTIDGLRASKIIK